MAQSNRKRNTAIVALTTGVIGFGTIVAIYLQKQQSHEEPPSPTVLRRAEPQRSVPVTNAVMDSASLERLMARLKATRAGIESKANQAAAEQASGGALKNPAAKQSTTAAEPQMSTADFVAALGEEVAKGDVGMINEILQKVPRSAECAEALKALVTGQGPSADLRRYAAEALTRIGTSDSVGFVVDQILAAQNAGDANLAQSLIYCLDAPMTVHGARVLFDLVLNTGRYGGAGQGPTDDLRSAARKALRNAPDREAIGNLAVELYLDPQLGGRNEVLTELFDGVSHPIMLSELAIRCYKGGSPENASEFLQRLGQVDDGGVVSAFVQTAKQEAQLLNQAAQQLHAWSLQHPEQAKPGLFMEYLTDSTRKPSERIVAAFGLAGVEDTPFAMRALEKAMNHESDPTVKASLVALQGFLAEGKAKK